MIGPQQYRKKPVVIEAIKWTGDNADVIEAWAGETWERPGDDALFIETLEGTMTASLGDWIIQGVQGEFYPCKPDIFEATYDSA